MKHATLTIIVLVLALLILFSGCTENKKATTETNITVTQTPVVQSSNQAVSEEELIQFVDDAVAYARANGREKAFAAFNDKNGRFVRGDLYVFAIDYNGTQLSDIWEPDSIGKDISSMTDSFGVKTVQRLAETARFKKGYVSYYHERAANRSIIESKLSVVEDVDGTYYIGSGVYLGQFEVNPAFVNRQANASINSDDLIKFVKSAKEYAQINGKEKALLEFNNISGQFNKGEMRVIALDVNGTLLADFDKPFVVENRLNLINYLNPDEVAIIRENRYNAYRNGGIAYSVVDMKVNGTIIRVPSIRYSEKIDDTWWIFSQITLPEYIKLRTGDTSGVMLRNHTKTDVYNLVNQVVEYAKTNGKERTLSEINNPKGAFSNGDLFVWAQATNGTLLADPYWKEQIGKNIMGYTDSYGQKTGVEALEVLNNGTGFMHQIFPLTYQNSTKSVPKLVYVKSVDDTWYIGSGVYGVEVIK